MNFDKPLALIGIVLMVGSIAAPAMAAAPTVDTEATDTTTESEITDGTNITAFEANSSKNSTLQASFDSTNPKVEIIDPETDDVVESYTASDMTQTGSASGNTYYNLSINHGDLTYLPIDSGENKSVTLRLYNNTAADNPDTTNVTLYLENVDGRTIRTIGSDASALELSTTFTFGSIEVPGLSSQQADWSEDGVATGGNGSTVTLHATNDTLVDEIGTFSDLDAETWFTGMTVKADGDAVKTYVDSAPSDAPDEYAVVDTENNDIVFHTDSTEPVDLSVSTNNLGVFGAFSAFGLEGVTQAGGDIISLSIGGFGSGMVLFLFGSTSSLRRRRQEE